MQPPPLNGVIRPNAKALSLGLSFVQTFANGPGQPFLSRQGLASSTKAITSGGTNMLGGVPAMAGNGAYWGVNSASNNYALPTVEGTVITALVADHNANDGVAHQPFFIGTNSANRALEAVKWSDNSFYVGILDKRMTFLASGLYVVGSLFTLATTWNATGQAAYLGGIRRATTASTGLGDTAGAYFVLGQNDATTRKWSSGTSGGILYALVFDQCLSPVQIAEADADMWWWARQPAWRREVAGPTPPTPSITGGGSIVTMPPDFGYPQSLTRGPPNPAMSV